LYFCLKERLAKLTDMTASLGENTDAAKEVSFPLDDFQKIYFRFCLGSEETRRRNSNNSNKNK
jgi:hypothetical protein